MKKILEILCINIRRYPHEEEEKRIRRLIDVGKSDENHHGEKNHILESMQHRHRPPDATEESHIISNSHIR